MFIQNRDTSCQLPAKLFILAVMLFVFFTCKSSKERSMDIWERFKHMEEIQLTFGEKGHFLYVTQYFSPDDKWIVYDTRNDDTHIGQTCSIEAVNTSTKEVRLLYQAPGQSIYGPGVGAASFSPVNDTVLFIHGLLNCDSTRPYGFGRRTGVAVSFDKPGTLIFMDARDVVSPFTPGALRGGTHAYNWSGDGEWISFTYNDIIMAELEKKGVNHFKDLRVVGIMAPYGPVIVEKDPDGENIDGEKFTVVISKVTENPERGSDQIERAHGDGWIGTNGYMKPDGSRQNRAVAFLGDTKDKQGNILTEVFIADIPEDITREAKDQPLSGTETRRPAPPEGTLQRRLTNTSDNKNPGVQGPRHWLRTTPDGSWIFFMMKDENGITNIHAVSPNGGPVKQISRNPFPVETSFSVSPDGQFLAYGSNGQVFVTHTWTGETRQVSNTQGEGINGPASINWSNDGKKIAYNRKVVSGDTSYFQIFLLK